MTHKIFCFCCLFVCLGGLLSALPARGQSSDSLSIKPGQFINGTFNNNSIQQFQVDLRAGECVVLELHALAARFYWETWVEKDKMLAVGDLEKATQNVWLVADEATTYFLNIRPANSSTSPQPFSLRISEQRPATQNDRNIFQAQRDQQQAIFFYGYTDAASWRQAATHSRKAAEGWERTGHPFEAAINYNLLGLSWQRLDEISASAQAYERALKLFKAIGNREQEANTTNNLASMFLRAGDAQQALDYLSAIYDAQDQRILDLQISRAYIFSGLAYRLLGDPTKARSFLELGLQSIRSATDRTFYHLSSEGQALIELGRTCLALGEHAQALAYLRESLALIKTNDFLWRSEGDKIHRAIGHVYFSLGNYQKAQQFYLEALTVLQEVGSPFHRAAIRNELGANALAQGFLQEAQRWFSEAVKINEPINNVTVALTAQVGLARVARQCGDKAAALARIEQALQLIESQRARIVSPDLRATFMATKREAFEIHVDLLAQLGEEEKSESRRAAAFAASEQARARSLLELISLSAAQTVQSADAQLTARERELRQLITLKANQQTRTATSKATAEQLAHSGAELDKLLAEYDRVSQQIQQRGARLSEINATQPLTLRDIQQQVLDEDTLLLEYTLGTERSWLFAVTKTGLQSFPLPPRHDLEKNARALYHLMEMRGKTPYFQNLNEAQRWRDLQTKEFDRLARELGQVLLAPVRRLMPHKRLMIVPDGALHYVPFAALPVPEAAASAEAKTKAAFSRSSPAELLIKNHVILTLPSASALAVRQRETRVPTSKTLAVFADPVFAPNDERIADTKDLVRSGKASENSSLQRLLYSRREAEALAALVPASQRKLALDFAAERATVMSEDLSQYRYVHFATHGVLNNEHSELSGLALSLVNQQGVAQNGYLRTLDIFKLKLNADLVVLSGCHTALGKEVSGEGLLGLTRGFMQAGARRVVASLWQVNDAATAEFMQQFYQGMLGDKRLSPAVALRAAQLAMSQHPRWQSPYYWASFSLQGDW